MRCRWLLALSVPVLALTLLAGAQPALAADSLADCPVYRAITSQRRTGDRGRSDRRYRRTRRREYSTTGHITNGLKDVLIAPLEIPMTMRRITVEQNLFAGLVAGPIEGFGNGLERMVTGASEVVVAPIPGIKAPVLRRGLGGDSTDGNGLLGDIFTNVIDDVRTGK